MLLEWTTSKDGNDNTHYHTVAQQRTYRIEPRLRNDRICYTTAPSNVTVSLGPDFRTVESAQRACERTEAALTGHVITPAEVILDWAQQNPRLSYFDPRRLSYSCPDFTREQLTEQLDEWVRQGKLRKRWGVLGPNSCMGHSPSGREDWARESDIPRRLRDTGDDVFSVDNGEIIPLYCKTKAFVYDT